MKKYQNFLSDNFQFLEVKFSIYLNSRIFVMSITLRRLRLLQVDQSLGCASEYAL